MVNAVAEDQFLKVHTARDGSIWFVEGAKKPVRSSLGMYEFPDGPEVARSSRVRMLGTWVNAPLVAQFYAFKKYRKLASIAVASPMLGLTSRERGDPQLMLMRMRDCAWPASLGGYHEVTAVDYPAYLLATYFQFNIIDAAHVDQAIGDHPLWRYLGFIPHLDRMKLARLVATIVDPRWYTRWDVRADEWNPRDYVAMTAKDAARLNQSLGLDPATMAQARLGHTHDYAARAQLVLDTWKTSEAPPPEACAGDPRYFLWQRWRTYDSTVKADLRVSQLFVDFLRQCWLDVLYMNAVRRGPVGKPDGLFAPEHFFRAVEAEAFRAHMKASETYG